jgi:hypothetical protein
VLDNGQRHIRLYCFGYQYYELKCIMVILPDDSVIITEDVDTVKIR